VPLLSTCVITLPPLPNVELTGLPNALSPAAVGNAWKCATDAAGRLPMRN
jgi:hypothetical protein